MAIFTKDTWDFFLLNQIELRNIFNVVLQTANNNREVGSWNVSIYIPYFKIFFVIMMKLFPNEIS